MKIRAFGRVLILIDEPELDFRRQKGGFRGCPVDVFALFCRLFVDLRVGDLR